MSEHWKAVGGTDGRYYVSDHGRVASRTEKPLVLVDEDGDIRTIHEPTYGYTLLTRTQTTQGHLQVKMSLGGTSFCQLIAKLVANHFLGPPMNPGWKDVKFLDNDETNCHFRNLEWYDRAAYNRQQQHKRSVERYFAKKKEIKQMENEIWKDEEAPNVENKIYQKWPELRPDHQKTSVRPAMPMGRVLTPKECEHWQDVEGIEPDQLEFINKSLRVHREQSGQFP